MFSTLASSPCCFSILLWKEDKKILKQEMISERWWSEWINSSFKNPSESERKTEKGQQIQNWTDHSELNNFFSWKWLRKRIKIYSPTPFESATKALKLEEDFSSGGCMSAMSMYPSDKMKMSAPGCFTGRYSPTSYRGPDQMRRCMTNPSVSFCFFLHHFLARSSLHVDESFFELLWSIFTYF